MTSFYIRSAVLGYLPKVIENLGWESDSILSKANISLEQLSDTDATISHLAFTKLLEEASTTTNCDHLGLLFGEAVSLSNLGLLGLLIRSSSSMREALKGMMKHIKVHSNGITRELHDDGNIAYISTSFESPEMSRSIQAIQMSIAISWKLSCLLSQNKWHPTSVYFTFSEPKDKTAYRDFFNLPVLFNMDFNGVVFHSSDLDLELPESDSFLHKEIENQLRKLEAGLNDDFRSEVKRYINKNLDNGICSIDSVVEYFPFEKRTFQQKLRKYGTTYQDLLDEVRFKKSEFYLSSSDISVSQLANLLGYKNVSVFSTAFKNEYGISPTTWKKSLNNI